VSDAQPTTIPPCTCNHRARTNQHLSSIQDPYLVWLMHTRNVSLPHLRILRIPCGRPDGSTWTAYLQQHALPSTGYHHDAPLESWFTSIPTCLAAVYRPNPALSPHRACVSCSVPAAGIANHVLAWCLSTTGLPPPDASMPRPNLTTLVFHISIRFSPRDAGCPTRILALIVSPTSVAP